MNKKKLIAIAIIAVIILLPFQAAYITFSKDTRLLQVLSMTVAIIGAVVAILLYNKASEETNHHH